MKQRLVFINSHPIQYFAPLYAELAKKEDWILDVWYMSLHGISGELDEEFGQSIRWDIPILKGYPYCVLSNQSPKPSIYSFWGLINLSIIKKLKNTPPSIIVVHGWNYFTNILAIWIGKFYGHTICLRGETPLIHEKAKTGWKSVIRKIALKYFLFKNVNYFLYIGQQNKDFYKHYKISEKKLIFTPYCVDNKRFEEDIQSIKETKKEVRNQLGIANNHIVFLFVGKYISKKMPLSLIKAFNHANLKDASLVLVGDGELRHSMEEYIVQKKIKNIHLTGFINQSRIKLYYYLSDVFIMASQEGETWGLSTNEAMNFSLPVLISDKTGCSYDLVHSGENGFVFKTGEIEDLANLMLNIYQSGSSEIERMGAYSKKLIKNYSFDQVHSGLLTINQMHSQDES